MRLTSSHLSAIYGKPVNTASDTAAGTLLTAGQDTILLAGIHDFEV